MGSQTQGWIQDAGRIGWGWVKDQDLVGWAVRKIDPMHGSTVCEKLYKSEEPFISNTLTPILMCNPVWGSNIQRWIVPYKGRNTS